VDNTLPRVTASPERADALGRRRLAAALVAIALAVTALVGGAAVSAGPAGATGVEDVFTTKMNHARASRGIPKLTTRSGLVSVARNWAATMAGQSKLYHNPQLTSAVNNWRYVGENVGYGPDALTVHVAFMNSPGHRANILDRDYTEVGVGAVVVGDRVWVAEVFRRPMRVTTSSVRSTSGFPGKLTYGSSGTAVKRVQARLGLSTTGYYGSYTRSAVSRFQKSLGWRGRGNVGRHTWWRLF
jgi:uncharacterized protein YkwD